MIFKNLINSFGSFSLSTYLCRPLTERPVRLRARTPPFHGGDTGSNPVRGTTNLANARFFYLWLLCM